MERVYRRKIPSKELITFELARYLTEISFEIGRQVGIIVDRKGVIQFVIAGDEKSILIPDLSYFRLGTSRLRGVRCIHTHLKNEGLNKEDITDLKLQRLDLIGVIKIDNAGMPGKIEIAHLIPASHSEENYRIIPSLEPSNIQFNYDIFIKELESRFSKTEDSKAVEARDRGILISVSTGRMDDIEASLEELSELARSARVSVLKKIIQRPKQINPKYLIGEGKLKEVFIEALDLGANILIFDQELTPAQIRSITMETDLKVIDRSQLILDIFAQRAHTRDGKVQVELAQLKYILPMLAERSTALSRLTGGIGGRGPGETKLEVHRRKVLDKIARLERELKQLGKARIQRKAKRVRNKIPIVSIVGYTNAGKSTLLNNLTKSRAYAEDLLFATLDTSSRRLRFPKEREIIITDTVGFIRNLPSDLFGAFKATFEELKDSDLLLHIVDISNKEFEKQIESVNTIVNELELGNINSIIVFNKIDKMNKEEAANLSRRFNAVPVSAVNQETFEPLLKEMERRLWK